jgi:hypothetical protein
VDALPEVGVAPFEPVVEELPALQEPWAEAENEEEENVADAIVEELLAEEAPTAAETEEPIDTGDM